MQVITKDSVFFAIEGLMKFAKSAVRSRVLRLEFVDELTVQIVLLRDRVASGTLEASAAVEELNKLIQNMNRSFSSRSQKAHYPLFSAQNPIGMLRESILAIEHYLNQKLRGGYLPLSTEQPLFQEAVVLWRDVGMGLPVNQGWDRLTSLVERMNAELPKELHYPLPPLLL